MKKKIDLKHLKAVLAIYFLLLIPLQLLAKDITVYFRDVNNDKLSLYIWWYRNDSDIKEPLGDWDKASDYLYQTTTIGGKEWKCCTVNIDDNKNMNVIIRKEGVAQGKIQTVDINGINKDTYLETKGQFSTSWSGTYDQGNQSTKETKKIMIFNELNRSEAEGKSINYVVHMKAKDGKSKKFYMTNVRNQEPGIHSISSNLFMVGIADKNLPGNNGEQVEFYVAGSDDGQKYDDGTQIHNQFRPYDNNEIFDFTQQKDQNGKIKTYAEYKNCQNENSSTFKITKGSGVSYTICLNDGNWTDSNFETNDGGGNANPFNPNKPVGDDDHTRYGARSVNVYTNKSLSEDYEGYTLIGNFLKTNDPNTDNQGLNKDDSWEPGNSERQYKMEPADKFDSSVGDPGDKVYKCILNKPANESNTMFFNICPNSLLKDNSKTWGGSEEWDGSEANKGKILNDKWNHIIRPQIQAGKDAISLQGCVEITPTEVYKIKDSDGKEKLTCIMNRSQAFNANMDDNNYSQFTVYLNLTKSMYTIVPMESIDLIGNAVGIINRGTGEWQQGQWENGERQYHYVRMARNNKLDTTTDNDTDKEQTTKCWEYTGKFYQYDVAGGRGGANAGNGFRFLINQTYVRNYIEDAYRPEHFTNDQKKAPDYKEKLSVNNPYWNEVMLDPYNGTDMNNPISPYNPSGSPIYGGIGNERDEGLHIGFVLPEGFYTMRFWQTTDKDGKVVKAWYTLGENVTPPNPLPDNTDVYKGLNCIRTFSSSVAYQKPEKMKVFIVDKYDNGTAHLKEISYIPANTGVILAYKNEDAESMKKDAGNLEFVGEADKEDQKYIFENFPSINFVEKQDADEDIGKNYLMPSVAPKDVKTTEYSDEANKTIAYRNYMFTAYKKKGENNKYILCFKRVITGKTSKNSAYLRLPAELCGGNKVTTNDQKIVGSSAQFPDYNTSASKECFASILWGDSEVTGIQNVNTDNAPTASAQADIYYTLQGVKISKPSAPGIYIKNGKKIMIK